MNTSKLNYGMNFQDLKVLDIIKYHKREVQSMTEAESILKSVALSCWVF